MLTVNKNPLSEDVSIVYLKMFHHNEDTFLRRFTFGDKTNKNYHNGERKRERVV